MVINKDNLQLFFGDATYNIKESGVNYDLVALDSARKESDAEKIFIAEQVHGVNGVTIDAQTGTPGTAFLVPYEADFLVTTQKKYALGVVTADCLPVVIYDPFACALAVAHAGWRGSSQRVVEHALGVLQQQYDVEPKNCQVYFGPSGQTCCYEVKQDFLDQVAHDELAQESLVERRGRHFFSLPTYNFRQLEIAGVKPSQISMDYARCTICSPDYFSYRRDREEAGRQVTYAVML